VFLKAVLKQRGPAKADQLALLWMASHVDHKHLQELTKEFQRQGLAPKTREELELAEVQDNWKRLSAFMGNRK
jgi:hypothetical protein